MNENLNFEFIFDGEHLDEGSIDVRDLAPTLLSLSELLDEAGSRFTPEASTISLRAKPNIEKKCFKIYLEIAQSYYPSFVELFSSQQMQAWGVLLSMVGVSGVGLLQLVKKSKKRSPRRVVEIEHTEKVRVVFDEDDDIEVHKNVFSLFQNPRARKAVEHMFKPLKKGGVDKMQITQQGEEKFSAKSEDADSFDFDPDETDELESEGEKILRIISPSFKKGNKWRLSDGSRTDYYEITDENFLEKVRNDDILFGSHDFLRAKVRTYQKIEDTEIKIRHEIFKAEKIEGRNKEQLEL